MNAILLISLILTTGCATNYARLGSSLKEVQPKLSGSHSFSFLHNGDSYFFAPEHFKQNGRECYLYLGFKNEKLAYAFSLDVFNRLAKIYAENDSPEAIKAKLVKEVEHETPTPNRCYDLGSGPPPDAGQGVAIALFFWPLTVPFATYALIDDQIYKKLLSDIADGVHLGMAKSEIPKFIQKKWQQKKKGNYKYYEFTGHHLKMILYFENDKLNAWSQAYVED